jgi:hypothetical protein
VRAAKWQSLAIKRAKNVLAQVLLRRGISRTFYGYAGFTSEIFQLIWIENKTLRAIVIHIQLPPRRIPFVS